MEHSFKSLKDFYPYYLTEHQDKTSRTLHFSGTALFMCLFVYAIVSSTWWLVLASIVCAYAFAWVGHFFFEKNKPATFVYPFFSLASDFIMFFHILTGQLPEKMAEAKRKMSR